MLGNGLKQRSSKRARQVGISLFVATLMALLPAIAAAPEADAAAGSRHCAQVSQSSCHDLGKLHVGVGGSAINQREKTHFGVCLDPGGTATGANFYLNGSYLTTKTNLDKSTCASVQAPDDASLVGTIYVVPFTKDSSGQTIFGEKSEATSYANFSVTSCEGALVRGNPYNVTQWNMSKYCPAG